MPAPQNARSESPRRDPRLRTLLIRPGAIGDLIVSLPALESCRTDFTEVWVSSHNVPLVRFANSVRSIASTGLDLLEFGADTRALDRMAGFDRIVSWYGSNRDEFRHAVRHLPVTFHTALPDGEMHAIDYYLRQVGAQPGSTPRLDVGPITPRDFVAIHPFSGSPLKNWPLENFQALAASLPCPVEFSAGPEELLDGAVRFENLWDVARWLATARAYVGNDSGVSHLAAAVGTPVIAIFRSTDPRVWAPRGNMAVRQDPTVQEVLGYLLTRLEEHYGAPPT